MSSHTNLTHSTGAQAPKRKRGHVRVAAILEAGAEIFAEKGYDSATMTEIAARSATAIGSLYRFFPSKDALADALLQRFAQTAMAGLGELEQQAAEMTLDSLAGALVDFMLTLQSQRDLTSALVDARGGSDEKRAQFRLALRGILASILCRAAPCLAQAKAEVMAITLLQILKAVPVFAQEKPATRSALLAELRNVVRLYLASI